MIELIGLNKKFSSVTALNDINLFIQEGEIFGIIGRSGAGKSTLLRSINLLERPDSGQVIVDNQIISEFSTKNLLKARYKIGMIFQHFNLLDSKTVYDNIALPSRLQGIDETIIKEKIAELLPLVELTEKQNAYPHELSGGQKQRVAIARALSYSPKILLCDEATSALDPETTESILELLKKINQIYGITIVMITHSMNVVKRLCHRIAVMKNGQITELNALNAIFNDQNSTARRMIFSELQPKLPACLTSEIINEATHRALLQVTFQGKAATEPFISQTSRDLAVDINILLANIDRFDTITCGALVIEINASPLLLDEFVLRCEQAGLIVEILGYVRDTTL